MNTGFLTRFVLSGGLTLSMLTGCGDERPPVQDEGTGEVTVQGPTSQGAPLESTSDAGTETCSAGTFRQCRQVFIDDQGNKNCPEALQYCRADGAGWLPCGASPDGPTTDE